MSWVNVKINSDDLYNMFVAEVNKQLMVWDDKVKELFYEMYERMIDDKVFEGVELSIGYIVANDKDYCCEILYKPNNYEKYLEYEGFVLDDDESVEKADKFLDYYNVNLYDCYDWQEALKNLEDGYCEMNSGQRIEAYKHDMMLIRRY